MIERAGEISFSPASYAQSCSKFTPLSERIQPGLQPGHNEIE